MIPPHADTQMGAKLCFSMNRTPFLGVLGIASYLRKHGHTVQVLDGVRISVGNGYSGELMNWQMDWWTHNFKPDLILVSVLTADFYEAQNLIRYLRERYKDCVIVAGGPHPSGDPVACLMQVPKLDGVGIGAGEETCLQLASGVGIEDVDNCAYLAGDDVVFTRKSKVEKHLDKYPYPAWDLVDTRYYCEPNMNSVFGLLTRSLPVVSGRGCPNHCYFCSAAGKGGFRVHSIPYIIKYCDWLVKQYPVDTLAFWDDVLGASIKRVEQFCEAFIKSGLHKQVGWSAQLRATSILASMRGKSGLLELMQAAGCVKISFGAESGSQNTLETLNKGVSVSENFRAALMLEQSGIPYSMSLMLGVPGESLEDMQATFRFIKSFPNAHFGVGRFCPLPGSPAYTDLVGKGLLFPLDVDWCKLGNFTLVDGPYFGAASHKDFQKLLKRVKEHIAVGNRHFFLRHNSRFPEVTRLYQVGFGRRVLQRLVPDSLKATGRKLLQEAS